MNDPLLFDELRPDDLKKVIQESGLVYLPLGTLEWHERHLPSGLDAMVSYYLCKEACKKTGGCVIPPLHFGTDREHQIDGKTLHGIDAKVGRVLTGSIYFINQELFLNLLRQIVTNISQQGFRKLVIVSAHSGTAQKNALEELSTEKFGDLELVVLPGKSFVGGMDHAGKYETRLMMGIRPDLIDISTLSEPYEGIVGEDPKLATKEDGEKQLLDIVNQIVELVRK